MRDCAKYAFDDLRDAKFFVAEGKAENISFVRRYRMKDGGVQTNPGVNNPNIDHVLDEASDVLKLIQIKRCGADDIYIVNFGVHPDVIGGELISADFPRFVRETLEGALSDIKCVFINAAQGDVNHINTAPTEADRVGLCYESFDGVPRGYEHAKHMGRVIAGSVLSICTKTVEVDIDTISFGTKDVKIPTNMENDKLQWAQEIIDMVNAGRQIIAASPFGTTVVCCLTNGGGYYYPTTAAYDEDGYEVKSSPLKKGVAEIITGAVADILNEIKQEIIQI